MELEELKRSLDVCNKACEVCFGGYCEECPLDATINRFNMLIEDAEKLQLNYYQLTSVHVLDHDGFFHKVEEPSGVLEKYNGTRMTREEADAAMCGMIAHRLFCPGFNGVKIRFSHFKDCEENEYGSVMIYNQEYSAQKKLPQPQFGYSL